MCKTLNQLENVVADYRSLKALKEELDEQLKALERDMIDYLDSNEKLSEMCIRDRDQLIEVSDEVAEVFKADARYEMAYQRRLSRHKAQYSLD